MTMVRKLRRQTHHLAKVAGTVLVVALACLDGTKAPAQGPPAHFPHAGMMPPGAIGRQQLQRGGSLPGYFQPVEIMAPKGVMISTASEGQFDEPLPDRIEAGMLIGMVYRLRVTNIPLHGGAEVFPTIEVIDRLYPPVGQVRRFPIPIQLTDEELEMALSGKFVTRVIYLEEPGSALPIAQGPNDQNYFEAAAGDDPLEVADRLGRPVAILRMGARLPDTGGEDSNFFYGCPPLLKFRTASTTDQLNSAAPLNLGRMQQPQAAVKSRKPILRGQSAR